MSHLVTLLQREDLSQLKDIIQLYFDLFKAHFRKVVERLVPEKSSIISSASYTLTTLSKDDSLNVDEINILKYLMEVCTPDC